MDETAIQAHVKKTGKFNSNKFEICDYAGFRSIGCSRHQHCIVLNIRVADNSNTFHANPNWWKYSSRGRRQCRAP